MSVDENDRNRNSRLINTTEWLEELIIILLHIINERRILEQYRENGIND